jgi:glycerol-3-phosphate dehydrogenase (NAD(P)+)
MSIGVIGAGSWGTAIGILLARKGHEVKIWDRNKSTVSEINTSRENIKYLPGIVLPSNLYATENLEECVHNSEIVIMAVPSHAIRFMCKQMKELVNKDQVFVSLAKGIENESFKRMSEVIEEYYPNNRIAVLSGPSHAEEVSRDIPTTVVATSKDIQTAELVQDIFITPKFRVYTNPDIIGVELGGAVKNIIALAAGISDGLGYGDNTKAALMTRGIAEIARLGVAMGADPLTFAGLSGIGDLIVTCTSMHSRNRRAGILIGKGKSVQEALDEVKMVVEGVNTTKSTFELSQKIGVEMPIATELFNVLFMNKEAKCAVSDLMLRDRRHETEEIARKNW